MVTSERSATPGPDDAAPQVAAEAYAQGVAAQRAGRWSEAEALFRRVVEADPRHWAAHGNLGVVQSAQQRFDEAEVNLRRALTLNPDYAIAHNNLGVVLRRQGRAAEAIESFRRATELKIDWPDALGNLGGVLAVAGRHGEAEAACRRAIAIDPAHAGAQINLATALKGQGRLVEAIAACERGLAAAPRHAEGHNNLAGLLQMAGLLQPAEEACRRALAIAPGYAMAHNTLGSILQEQSRSDEAAPCYRAAITLKPDYAEAYSNLAVALTSLGDLDDALASCGKAIALKPDYADAHWNKALALLLCGDFAHGWAEYEWRKRADTALGRALALSGPEWDGTALNGGTILLHAEQGLGDTIQFVRYAPLVAARGGKVVLRVQPELRRLLAGMDGVERLVTTDDALPPYDVHLSLLSLPRVFATEPSTIPRRIPYVAVEAEAARAWARRLAAYPGRRVGLAWAGRPQHKNDRNRSLALRELASLGSVSGVTFVSLQKGPAAAQLSGQPAGFAPVDVGGELDDFVNTAAAIANLDLVISVDTSVAHLAGALGRPVWCLLPYAPDWRWMLGRDDSPWYPTMRLFRQARRGEWSGVATQIVKALEAPP
jgi:tetratricopeptide (TPR) repeat protein